jgi:hypothetical protein
MSSAASKKTQENMNQKLGLVIKSGKYKLGKSLCRTHGSPLLYISLAFRCLLSHKHTAELQAYSREVKSI